MSVGINIPRAIEYPVFADDRGTFAPFINGLKDIAPNAVTVKRIYYVCNDSKGIVRGFHYHKKEWKFFVQPIYMLESFLLLIKYT